MTRELNRPHDFLARRQASRAIARRLLASSLFFIVATAPTTSGIGFAFELPPFGVIDTIVGSGVGDGGLAFHAIVDPRGLALCGRTLFIADGLDHRVRKLDLDTLVIQTIAGTGVRGFAGDGGAATAAQLNFPTDLVCATDGTVFVADTLNHRIRKISRDGTISTVAGDGRAFSSGDGGPAVAASINSPRGIALDSSGALYIAETDGNRIRKVSANGIITTVAGNGSWGYAGDNGPAVQAKLANPWHIALDGRGNLFIADYGNSRIRRVDAQGMISTVVGDGVQAFTGDGGPASGARIFNPGKLSFDALGNLYFTDVGNNRVRKLTAIAGVISSQSVIDTVAGNGVRAPSDDGGLATRTSFALLTGLAWDAVTSSLYIGQYASNPPNRDNRARAVLATGTVAPLAGGGVGDGGPAEDALVDPAGLLVRPLATANGFELYIADSANHRVRAVSSLTGTITTVAGAGTPCAQGGSCGDNGLAIAAQLTNPIDVDRDAFGNLYVAELGGHRIRKIDAATGIIATVAGTGSFGYNGDNIPATQATLANPWAVAVTPDGGTFYIADFQNNRIRKVENGIITTVAGNGLWGNPPDGSVAVQVSIGAPTDVALGPDGNLYFVDRGNHIVRRIRAGLLERVAGTGWAGFSGDGGPATQAQLSAPTRIAFDQYGGLLIADANNYRIRRVDMSTGIITTVVGNGAAANLGDKGPVLDASLTRVAGMTIDAGGHLFLSVPDGARVRVASLDLSPPEPTPTPWFTATRTTTGTPTVTSSPTPTPSPTLSPSNTPTPTFTPTATSTNTPTLSFTPTNTGTPTSSPTYTPTRTHTPTATFSFTPTKTFTPTNTPTNTNTFTPTATRTPTSTRTNTPTPTFTFTPSNTPTLTATRTATSTRTWTLTATPSRTPTQTFTPTRSPTRTATNTATNTRTSTPTRTPTFTATASRTYTLTPTPSASFTPTATRTPSSTATPTATASNTATRTPTNTPTASFSRTPSRTSTPTRTATSTATSTSTRTATATLSPTRTASPTATPTPTAAHIRVSGQVTYFDDTRPLPDVLVRADTSWGVLDAYTTTDGSYAIDQVPPGSVNVAALPEQSQSLVPRMNSAGSGITAGDASRVLQIVVGIAAPTGIQNSLCDTDANGSITAADAVILLQHVVGNIAPNSCIGSWVVKPTGALPPMATPTPAVDSSCGRRLQVSLAEALEDVSGINFVAGVVGDCDGSLVLEPAGLTARAFRTVAKDAGPPEIHLGKALRQRTAWRVPIEVHASTPWRAATVRIRFDARRLRGMRISVPGSGGSTLAAYRVGAGEAALALARTQAQASREVIAWLVFEGRGRPSGRMLAIESAQLE